MQRTSVSSSDIRSIGYDAPTAVLEVEFNAGGVYRYFNVPVHVHNNFMIAASHGQFLNDYIRYNYQYQRVS